MDRHVFRVSTGLRSLSLTTICNNGSTSVRGIQGVHYVHLDDDCRAFSDDFVLEVEPTIRRHADIISITTAIFNESWINDTYLDVVHHQLNKLEAIAGFATSLDLAQANRHFRELAEPLPSLGIFGHPLWIYLLILFLLLTGGLVLLGCRWRSRRRASLPARGNQARTSSLSEHFGLDSV